jgi:hypothetical protein
MRRNVIKAILILGLVYFLGYILIRQTKQEIWERDGKIYVIFPEDKFLYYLYRPLSLIDEKVTGIRFHIGQHR